MRVVLGLLLLLLGLCGSGAQGEGGGLDEVGAVEESSEQTTKQTTCDIWAEVVELKVQMELLKRENSVQATQLISLEIRLTATESKTSDLEKQNADLQTRLSNSESELLVSKSRIDQLERINEERPKVAFYTALTNSGHVGPYNTAITLKFSKVFTNIGNAYNPATGFFTAPVKGVYYFQFTVFGFQAGSMGITVYKNSKRIMDNWGSVPNGGSEYITNSLVLELIAGDEIHLVLPSGYSLFDNETNYSTFSGALLFPL
ncbi:heavy metal-binding protein HIP-like [Dicentrarchus labrax]|uniref:heavy metal-binding protein HIP-like n=1 Tax=Dicentrarchus labrax TaxID=13489 RepID=UPI0021F56F1A|nr:heavy metal-binding protein HIP-like [Dicentrarchus labrax]